LARIIKEDEALDEALRLAREGLPIAIPTETVYGLAADACNGEAVARIYEVKGRPRFNPLIAHVADMEMAERFAQFSPSARLLAEHFWPGPLTLVLPARADAGLSPLVMAGLDTVALRCPKGFGARLIKALGRPLAAPSANSSGKVSGTSAQAVERDLGERIELIVDGGATPVGVESTIVKVEDENLVLLRPGGIAADDIEAVAGKPLQRGAKGIQAPGMMASHYAPDAPVRLNVSHVEADEALLAFGPERVEGAEGARATLNLSPSGDLREAASNLFAHLLALDAAGGRAIAVEPVPTEGLGEAINDRLARAAAPRQ